MRTVRISKQEIAAHSSFQPQNSSYNLSNLSHPNIEEQGGLIKAIKQVDVHQTTKTGIVFVYAAYSISIHRSLFYRQNKYQLVLRSYPPYLSACSDQVVAGEVLWLCGYFRAGSSGGRRTKHRLQTVSLDPFVSESRGLSLHPPRPRRAAQSGKHWGGQKWIDVIHSIPYLYNHHYRTERRNNAREEETYWKGAAALGGISQVDSLVSLLKKNFFMEFLLYAIVHGSEGQTHLRHFVQSDQRHLTEPESPDFTHTQKCLCL